VSLPGRLFIPWQQRQAMLGWQVWLALGAQALRREKGREKDCCMHGTAGAHLPLWACVTAPLKGKRL